MPPSLNTQTTIAFIWDFDKTLTPGYMQAPLFEAFNVDPEQFWREVNSLAKYYRSRRMMVSADTAYLGHILSYVQDGPFAGLTNAKLRELGAHVPLAPGMPEFMARTRKLVADDERYNHHGIAVEHYIVSTGLRQMIEGNPISKHVDGIWACELLADPPSAGYLDSTAPGAETGVLSQIGYVLDNTTKTRAIFEINKGANVEQIDVNARMAEEDRRIPIANMVYVADGPSDVPSFSVVGKHGGMTFGVYTRGSSTSNYDGVRQLQDDGRVNSIAEADYREGSPADLWLMSSLRKIANGICDRRDQAFANIIGPAGHKV
ncbi:MAG TPA: HAD family hydrolase [Amycolatopsis sp.]|uniref:HAD family hydrolase n=1 Tax=Amycolatopsis sp. TaxID=37632 RepID=UPI002F428B40